MSGKSGRLGRDALPVARFAQAAVRRARSHLGQSVIRVCLLAPLAVAVACRPADEQAEVDPAAVAAQVGSAAPGLDVQHVSSAARGPRDEIVLVDEATSKIHVLGPRGDYRFTVGPMVRGSAPLRSPCCVVSSSDSALWVLDRANAMLLAFRVDSSGARVERAVPLSLQPSGLQQQLARNAAGEFVVVTDVATERSGDGIVLNWTSAAGDVRKKDSLIAPAPPAGSYTLVRSPDGRSTTGVHQPFGPVPLRAISAHGDLATAVSGAYDIRVHAADGGERAHIVRVATAPRVSAAERKRAEATLNGVARRTSMRRTALNLSVPERKAPLQRLAFDADGRLWVQRAVRDGALKAADVFDRRGHFVDTRYWPSNAEVIIGASRGDSSLALMGRGPIRQLVWLSFPASHTSVVAR
jgi:hypothetical protein